MTYVFMLFMLVFAWPVLFGSWRAVFASLGLQAMILAAIAAHETEHFTAQSAFVVLDLLVVRGVLVPFYVADAVSKSGLKRPIDVIPANFVYWTLALALAGSAAMFAGRLFPHDLERGVQTTAAVSEVLVGLLILTRKRSTVGQAIGVLTLENGIVLFEMLLESHFPFVVQLGVATVFVLLALVFASFIVQLPADEDLDAPSEEGDVL